MSTDAAAELTAADIQGVVRTALPTVCDLSPCHRIKEGSEHNVWLVGPDIVLRGLRATGRSHGKSEVSLARDAAVCALLRKYLTRPDWVPEVFATVTLKGWVCNLEQRVRGTSLEVACPTARTEEDLVVLLRGLAQVPVDEAKQAVGYVEDSPNARRRVFAALRAWNDLVQAGYATDPEKKMDAFLKQRLARQDSLKQDPEQRSVLLHSDISGEHILVDGSGSVEGVIDWSDAIIGDGLRDVAGLSLAVGLHMASRIGLKAGYSSYTVEKGLTFAMCVTTLNLRERICGDDNDGPEMLLRSQFRRAFEGTGFADLMPGPEKFPNGW